MPVYTKLFIQNQSNMKGKCLPFTYFPWTHFTINNIKRKKKIGILLCVKKNNNDKLMTVP